MASRSPDGQPERFVGSRMARREDRRLIAGDAEYVDDITYPHQAHLAILRSPYGHARIEGIETGAAEAMADVLAVVTAADLLADGVENELPGDDPEGGRPARRPILAADRVRYQGDPVAAVVAEDRYTARDAAAAIEIDYDRLEAVTDVAGATASDAPTVHEHASDNVAFEWAGGDRAATEAALESADQVVELDLEINKVVAVPLETRSANARYRAGDDHLSVDVSTQNVLAVQDDLAAILGVPEHRVSVRAPDVGGAFGVKLHAYTGHVLAAWCAMAIERPVKWVATRTEAFQSSHHARRHSLTARAGVDGEADLVGIHVESIADVGGYLTQFGSKVPAANVGTRLTGAYDVPTAFAHVTGVFTNSTPLSAYRGAGRPEATYVIERLVDTCAREVGVDPAEFRRRNFVPTDAFPYENPFGATYDSGDYETALERALAHVDYAGLRERQAAARAEGRYLGVGLSTYIEICGGGADSLQGGSVRMLPSGRVVAATSQVENGQGHATSFAQIVADELGVDTGDVEIVSGDSDRAPEGGGTGGSKAVAMGGNALKVSAARVRERARAIAATRLEVAPDDLEFEAGTFAVRGAPDRAIDIGAVAAEAYSADLPADRRGLEDTTYFSPDGSTTPFGAHVAVVEVDPETGAVGLERYVAVDDVGVQVNPTLIEGQIVGGVVQSVGQALLEEARYDEAGTLVTGSLQDYALPRAHHVPDVTWDSTVTPSPNNPLGAKGVGEAGTIGATPAVVNAVVDALAPLGVDSIDMPLSGERVYRAIQSAAGSQPGG